MRYDHEMRPEHGYARGGGCLRCPLERWTMVTRETRVASLYHHRCISPRACFSFASTSFTATSASTFIPSQRQVNLIYSALSSPS